VDLGITGRCALVAASSEGLGLATALALAQEGVAVTMVARREQVLNQAAEMVRRSTGATVTAVVADISTPEGRKAALDATPVVEILVNNIGGAPTGDFRNYGLDDWRKVIDSHLLAPVALIQATLDTMIERKFGRIINITTMGMRKPHRLHPMGNGARGGLTAFVAGIANEHVQHNVTINNALPGPMNTGRMVETTEILAKQHGITYEEMLDIRLQEYPAHRWGRPAEFGAVCAFLASEHASYITGQNILVDGGAAPTTF
jgi:3-oxoacyl-[acyl-carrier protein] reductase